MPRIVHARISKKGPQFRLWSTIVDSYVTESMTEPEMITYLVDELLSDLPCQHTDVIRTELRRQMSERIQRTLANGTSEMGATRSLIRWDKNRKE